MVHHLMRYPAIVLQDVVIRCARGRGDALGHGHDFREVLVGNVGQFGAVELGDYEGVAAGEGLDV